MDEPKTLTIIDLAMIRAFVPGDVITMTAAVRWYVRLWRWAKRFGRKQTPTFLTIVAVDYDTGAITVEPITDG